MTQIIPKWETIEDKHDGNLKIFDLHRIRRRHPVWRKESEFIILDSPRWVNIIPVTTGNNVVLIEQYRQGIDCNTLEVPGGLVEAGEDTRHAAERECREETGFAGSADSVLLGENYPNPAFLNNKCWSYVWFDCYKQFTQKLDSNEDIKVIEVPLSEIKNMITSGQIKHSLVLTAFFFFSMKYGL
ncbi:MAG: hydrolase [Ignavibacteria bacterium]|nr:hydrolase [Ignavibacteria bacterium]